MKRTKNVVDALHKISDHYSDTSEQWWVSSTDVVNSYQEGYMDLVRQHLQWMLAQIMQLKEEVEKALSLLGTNKREPQNEKEGS